MMGMEWWMMYRNRITRVKYGQPFERDWTLFLTQSKSVCFVNNRVNDPQSFTNCTGTPFYLLHRCNLIRNVLNNFFASTTCCSARGHPCPLHYSLCIPELERKEDTRERRTCIWHVLCVRRPNVDSQALLVPRSRCFGLVIVLPRRYSGSKTLILAETVLIHAYLKDKRALNSI